MKYLLYALIISFLLLFSACSSSDGKSTSALDTVLIADAGIDQNIKTLSTVTLDGSGSISINGGALVYKWSFISKPANSGAAISDVTSVRPSFVADLAGVYVAGLVVNDGKVESDADVVTITATTDNSAPVANAGSDQNVKTTSTVVLDGSASSDVDLDPLSYHWNIKDKPTNSNASFFDKTVVAPSFVADLNGTYVAELVVNDGSVDSAADTVNVTAATVNSAPVANAGEDQKVNINDTVTLDGSASSDADLDPLTYSWNMISKPTQSEADLSNPITVDPTFSVDKDGNYVVQLIVNDGTVDSLPSTVTVSTSSLDDFAMTIDVNKVSIQADWKVGSNAPGDSIAAIKQQGIYGSFSISGDLLTYQKTTEGNATDSGVLEVTMSGITYDVVVTVNALYWVQVSAGHSHTVAIKSDGTLWGWGDNRDGELGDGTTNSTLTPVQESTLSSWKSTSAGDKYTAAIKSDGTLWAWGYNNIGQLGDGTKTNRYSPTQEESNSMNWIAVSTGANHTLAIKSTGTLWAWGSNGNGTLGDGTNISKSTPAQENTYADDWVYVNGGDYHSVAIQSDGTLWAWGRNNEGQLGVVTSDNYSYTPVQEDSLSTNWIKADAGKYHTAALKNDGTVWEWGSDINGYSRISPIQEESNTQNWRDVTAGSAHIVSLKNAGTLWSWGENGDGQLGDGTKDSTSTPIQELSKASDWIYVDANAANTFVIKRDGTLWGWGNNASGQLGDGTNISRSEPVRSQRRE